LALYAGEDLDVVIEQLDSYADRNPDEVGFYIPQLCTYLFHVSNEPVLDVSVATDTTTETDKSAEKTRSSSQLLVS
jgi:hypothetical protein